MIHLALLLLATIFVIGTAALFMFIAFIITVNHARAVRIVLQTIAAATFALLVGIYWNSDQEFHLVPALVTFWLIALQPFTSNDLKKFVKGK